MNHTMVVALPYQNQAAGFDLRLSLTILPEYSYRSVVSETMVVSMMRREAWSKLCALPGVRCKCFSNSWARGVKYDPINLSFVRFMISPSCFTNPQEVSYRGHAVKYWFQSRPKSPLLRLAYPAQKQG
jgi:hypothetical protein